MSARSTDLNFERRVFLVPFGLGILITAYSLLQLGHGAFPFGATRLLKITGGATIAVASWILSSRKRTQDVQSWLRKRAESFKAGPHTNFSSYEQSTLSSSKQEIAFEPSAVPGGYGTEENLKRSFLLWLVFSGGLLWLGPFSIYSPIATLDPWIYTGAFTNLHGLVSRYGMLYNFSRLPYVVFGVLMYKVFSPLAANYLIKVTILAADVFSLFAILLRRVGYAVAVVSALVFACNPGLIATVCWDYPDGAAIAFLMLGFWMALTPPRRWEGNLATIAAGAFWAMAGYTNLIAGLIIIPGVVIMLYAKRVSLREALKQCAWLAVGVALVTTVFGFISQSIFHTFAFWVEQWKMYRWVTTTKGLLDEMWGTGFDWIMTSYRLAATYGVTLVGIFFLARHFRRLRNERFFLTALLLLILSDLMFAFAEFGMKAVVLRVSYTSSYLVVPTFIFLGALFSVLGKIAEGDEAMLWFRVFLGMTLAGMVLPILLFCIPSLLLRWQFMPGTNWMVLAVLGLSFLLAASLSQRMRRPGIIVATCCLTMLVTLSTALNFSHVFLNRRQEFKAAIATQSILMTGILKNRPLRFWFDDNERYGPLYESIQALYPWRQHDFTHVLPTMPADELRGLIPPDTVVIHLTSVPEKMTERVRLLAARNIKVEEIGHWTIERGDVEFEVFVQHVPNASEVK